MLAQIFDAITNLAGAEDIISQRYPNGQWIADFGLRIFRSAEPFLWIMGLGLPAEFAKDPQSQSAIANPQSPIRNPQSAFNWRALPDRLSETFPYRSGRTPRVLLGGPRRGFARLHLRPLVRGR